MPEIDRLMKYFSSWGLSHGARVLGIVALVFALNYLLRLGVRSFIRVFLRNEFEGSAKEKRVKTLSRVLTMAGNVLILVSGAMMVLSEFGIDMKPLLASVGIGGLALGFGAQSLVKDLIAGFFIILEDQIRVGDVVQVGDKGGLVESVGLRVMVLRDISGNRIIIPNGEVTTVTNMTYEFSRYRFKIGVAYKEDVDRVIETIREVGEQMRKDGKWRDAIKEPIEVFGLDEFGDSALIIAGRLTTAPLKQWEVGREFNRRIKMAFDEKGIEMPFPHRTVFFGNAPPAGKPHE
jgi:small conductance mechanosensitive channel